MPSIFTQIINQKIPSYTIAENSEFIAFLDVFPLKEGHTLIVPKKEVDYIFDLPDNELAQFNIFSKKIALAIEQAIPCKRIGTAVIGLEVPHAHIHLLPLETVEDINFTNPKITIEATRMSEIAEKIKSFL